MLIYHYVILVFFLQFTSIVQFRFVALTLAMSCLCVFIFPGLSQPVVFLVYFLDKKPGERPRKSKCCIMNSFLFHAIYINIYEEERDAVGQRKMPKEKFLAEWFSSYHL